jgi:hypothetical protein
MSKGGEDIWVMVRASEGLSGPQWTTFSQVKRKPQPELEFISRLITRRLNMKREKVRLFEVTSRINDFTIYNPTFAEPTTIYPKMSEQIKYKIYSYTYDNFPVYWHYDDKERPSLRKWRFDMDSFYEQTIKDYRTIMASDEHRSSNPETTVLDSFFEEEAKELFKYLTQAPNIRSFITETNLPIDNNLVSGGWCEGLPGCYIVHSRRNSGSEEPEKWPDVYCDWFSWPIPDDTLLPFDVYSYFSFAGVLNRGAILKEKKVMETVVDSKEKKEVWKWRKEIEKEMESIPPMENDAPDRG